MRYYYIHKNKFIYIFLNFEIVKNMEKEKERSGINFLVDGSVHADDRFYFKMLFERQSELK